MLVMLELLFCRIGLPVLFMNRIAHSLIEAFFHAIPSINSLYLEFLFIKCFIREDQLIAHVLDLDDVALSLETVYRNVSYELVYLKVPPRDQILILGPS